jgi:hypothetical protein
MVAYVLDDQTGTCAGADAGTTDAFLMSMPVFQLFHVELRDSVTHEVVQSCRALNVAINPRGQALLRLLASAIIDYGGEHVDTRGKIAVVVEDY